MTSQINDDNPGSLGNVIVDELKRASSITIKDIGWTMAENTQRYIEILKNFLKIMIYL